MRIVVINPNSDEKMTEVIGRSAKNFAKCDFEIECVSTPGAPKFLETYEDAVRAAPGMVELVQSNEESADAFVVACHSDVNLDVLKEKTKKPVVGIGEASMKIASMLGHSFSVVTTHRHSVPGKVAQARKYHLQDLMVSVRAPDEGTTDFDDNEEMFFQLSKAAVEEDLAEVIVLGCAGLAGLDKILQMRLGVPVLDGVTCALILAAGFVRYGVSTSKALGYDPNYE
jgi:allantoin racemase